MKKYIIYNEDKLDKLQCKYNKIEDEYWLQMYCVDEEKRNEYLEKLKKIDIQIDKLKKIEKRKTKEK